ncbi:MAG: type II toxin-antitoxin system VapC family toxin [Desulfobacteraceae bacterium]|nr:type II toxin-antitoxin system VapC family toxin [Desulfobacteraceae bacterium]
MKVLLDTNICIYLINPRSEHKEAVREHFLAHQPGDIGISAITLAELEYGVENSRQPEKNRQALEEFTVPLEVLPFNDRAAAAYGKIRAALRKQPIGPLDILIAAHALALEIPMVTNNTSEFERVPGLTLQNWTIPTRGGMKSGTR